MKHSLLWIGACALAMYAASGLYVVNGDEQGLVRRFGKARFPLAGSGLHYDLPWPFARVDRINLHQVRTISIGLAANDLPGDRLMSGANLDRQGEFLTGDKNILGLQVSVPYHVGGPAEFLFGSASPEVSLRLLAESVVTETISRCGVDFVHPLGLGELRETLTRRLQAAVESQHWGIEIEDVTIMGVVPPVEVKAAFLDVSNARAEKDRIINEEITKRERLVATARASADRLREQARSDRQTRMETARGAADRFRQIIAQFKRESLSGAQTYEKSRQMTLRRMYVATLEAALPKLAGKVILDSLKPIDLTIFPRSEEGVRKPPEKGPPP